MKVAFPSLFSREEFWLAAAALAVGLVVAWILRGAPPGQAAYGRGRRRRATIGLPRPDDRGRGGGAALDRSAAATCALARHPVSVPIFALGFGLVIFLIARNRRYRHASPTLRRTIDFSTAFLNASLLGGILIVANVIAFRYGGQPLDMTREGSYTLSTETTAS